MNIFKKFVHRITSFYATANRFIVTILFLIAFVVVNIININSDNGDVNYEKYLFALIVGAVLSAVMQLVYERFFTKSYMRIILMVISILLTAAYFLYLNTALDFSQEYTIRTSVVIFTIVIAFIWVPSIKSKITFNESFLVVFKAFFIAMFFSSIIFLGITLIITATNTLLFDISENAYMHSANIIYALFASVYFMSLIPVYHGNDNHNSEESIRKAISCPKFLEVLISYIVIPLSAVFTLILVIYIVINIGNSFWTNNLLEPMLVTYAIVVILVYILSSNLQNKTASLFRKIFPKVLLIIVLLQTSASIIKIWSLGIPYTRYYVILFGIFAICAGVIFSILPVKKNSIVAVILIVLSAISVIPPVDAFSIGKSSQISILKSTLTKNSMLENGEVIPNAEISTKDKVLITQTVNYIDMMGYEDDISWLSDNKVIKTDFYQTFGFYEEYGYNNNGNGEIEYYEMHLSNDAAIDIENYKNLISTELSFPRSSKSNDIISDFEQSGKNYSLSYGITNDRESIILYGENKEELISLPIEDLFEKIAENSSSGKGELSLDMATLSKENDKAMIKVVIKMLSINKTMSEPDYYTQVNIMTAVK